MIDQLIHMDLELFKLIHVEWSNSLFDVVLPYVRKALIWTPLYGLFIYLALKNYGVKGVYIIISAVAIVAICDRFSAGFMKPYFERLRPCKEPLLADIIRPLIDCGGQYGFISSHATNHFGLAVMFTWFFKSIATKKTGVQHYIFYIWAALISYAQIYVGKHYFGDVLVGMIFGLCIGYIVLAIFKKLITIN